MLPGIFIGNALISGGCWTGDVLIADWQDIENNVASKVHVNQFKSKEVGIKMLQEAFTFPCAEGSLRQEGHAQRQTFRHQRVESLDAGGVPSTLGEARSDPLQCVRDNSLQEEESQTFLKLIATPWKQKEDVWSVSGEPYLSPPCSCPENTCMYRKSYHSQFRQNTLKSRGKQKPIWTIWKRVVSMYLWSTDGIGILYESWSGSNQGYSWMDGRLTKTQVTSRPETIW